MSGHRIAKGTVMIDPNDIIGERSGKLTVLRYVTNYYDMTAGGERMRHTYLCQCDCGNYTKVQRGPLLNGVTRSCGCARHHQGGSNQ